MCVDVDYLFIFDFCISGIYMFFLFLVSWVLKYWEFQEFRIWSFFNNNVGAFLWVFEYLEKWDCLGSES